MWIKKQNEKRNVHFLIKYGRVDIDIYRISIDLFCL